VNRRQFQKLAGTTALATALSPVLAAPRARKAASSVDRLTYDYSQFCAVPERQRIFHAVRGGTIVSERLDERSWRPTDYSALAALPIVGGSTDGVPLTPPLPQLAGQGPFEPSWESLLQYACPDWYRDAKFGIWNHWSPQCVAEDGDWYARNLYEQGSMQGRFHREHYGHPSRVGYKDLCAQWTLLNWQPEQLMAVYRRAGAQFFLALANHHDGFDTWNSRHHPWNAQNMGPRRDVIGDWASAARHEGLRFGVSVHQARNWWWFQTAHGSDSSGPLAGVAYDGRLRLEDGKGQWWEGYDPCAV